MPQNRKAMIAATPRFVSAAPLVFSMGGAEVGVASVTGHGGWKRPSSSEAFPDTPSFASISDSPNTPVFDELEWDHGLNRQQPGRLTKSALLTLTRVVLPQFARPVVLLGLAETQHRPSGTWRSGGCPKGPKRRAA